MVCLRNISVDTLHKGDTEDNNNNNKDGHIPKKLHQSLKLLNLCTVLYILMQKHTACSEKVLGITVSKECLLDL